MNSGVCIKGTCYGDNELDYYGLLEDVIELDYYNPSNKETRVVLFKCHWFDPVENRGWRRHKQYDLVEIHNNRRFTTYEPFILASQAQQVYFAEYACKTKERQYWRVVYKIRPQRSIDSPDILYQETEILTIHPITADSEILNLRDAEHEDEIVIAENNNSGTDNEESVDEDINNSEDLLESD